MNDGPDPHLLPDGSTSWGPDEQRYVVVEFLTEGLGKDKINVYGPYQREQWANERTKHPHRTTRVLKVVPLIEPV